MTELDFDREGFPFQAKPKAGFLSSEDDYARTVVLPLMWQLSAEERLQFDDMLVRSYAQETANSDHQSAMEVLRRLPMDELVEVTETLGFLTAPQ